MTPEVTVKSSRDFDSFNRMINHPSILPYVRDDSSPEILNVSLLDKKENEFLKVEVFGNEAGFAFFLAGDDRSYEMHSGMLPDFRGRVAIQAGLLAIEYMFIRSCARKITTYAWSTAKNVILAARMVGFDEIARESWPSTVAGRKVDLVRFSLSFSKWISKSKTMEQVA